MTSGFKPQTSRGALANRAAMGALNTFVAFVFIGGIWINAWLDGKSDGAPALLVDTLARHGVDTNTAQEVGIAIIIFAIVSTLFALLNKKILFFITTSSAATLPLAFLWWELWMEFGFADSPLPLSEFLNTDGEHSYDAHLAGMAITVFVVLFATLAIHWFMRKR